MGSSDTVNGDASAHAALSRAIKIRRSAAGLSQPQLASRIGYSRQYVSRAERAHNLPSQDLIRAIDTALETGGELLELWRAAKTEQLSRRSPLIEPAAPSGNVLGFESAQVRFCDHLLYLRMPVGRFFAGSKIPTIIFPAIPDSGRVVATPPTDVLTDSVLAAPGRALVVARVDTPDQLRFYVMDRRRARARLAAAVPGAPLLVPRAYLLDDFTLAIIWAVDSLDNALLDDDTGLADAVTLVDSLDTDSYSAVGRDLSASLSPVSRMWIGSDFCARHVLRNADKLTDTPQFWSREQRGEEASTWLLFTHKYQYLQATARRQDDRPIRAFCIPPDNVHASASPERILLFLTAALHESMGITAVVCTEPEYTATPGFVLDRTRRAVVANWVNIDRVWHVDITGHRPTLREFDDAMGWARTYTVLPGETPGYRLHAFADYLELDWTWLTRRAAELADRGIAGLCAPRSRLLSIAGLERACGFLADLVTEDR